MAFRSPRVITSLLTVLAVSSSAAAEFTGYAVLTTDYVFRGVSYSDSHAAAQLGGDVALDSGIFVGVWASTVDLSGGPGNQRDLQVNYYLGYGVEVTNKWSAGANVVSYNFPDDEGPFDYDYVEYSLTTNYNDQVWFEYSYSPDLYNTDRSTHNYDLYAEWHARGQLTVGAGAGYYDVSDLLGSGYSYWQIGATHPLGLVDVDFRYHGTSDWLPLISSPDRADDRVVLSVSFQF